MEPLATPQPLAPVEEMAKRTEFYKMKKKGKGWYATDISVIPNRWSHYEIHHWTELSPKIPLKKLKSRFAKDLKKIPYTTRVFEFDIVAPSEIILVIWVGMRAVKQLQPRTIEGKYTQNCCWPDDMTKEQYLESQEY